MDKFNPSFSSIVSPDLALLNKIDFFNCVKATTSCFQHNSLLPPSCSDTDFFLKTVWLKHWPKSGIKLPYGPWDLMVPRAYHTRFLKIVFDSAEIFDF
jgi:hypothetical protein